MYIYQVERDLLRNAINSNKGILGGKVLDAGSGPNKKYQDILKKGSKYVTLDIHPEFKPDIVGSVENIPVPDGDFDSVISVQVLGDLLRPELAIKEFRRIVKPGGMVLITEGFMNELHGEPRDFWRFTPYGLSGLMEENGFKVVKAEIVGGFFTVIAQMKMRFLINILGLYDKRFLGRVFSKLFMLFGKLAMFLDKVFGSKAKRKFGLGVLVLAEAINDPKMFHKHD